MTTGSHRQLTALRLRSVHGRGDLGEVEPEHFAQNEDGTFERAQSFEK